MLALTLGKDNQIRIGENIIIRIGDKSRGKGKVTLLIDAPKQIPIKREANELKKNETNQ